MNIDLRRLDEDQLWQLYRQQVENEVEVMREIKRRIPITTRSSKHRSKAVDRRFNLSR